MSFGTSLSVARLRRATAPLSAVKRATNAGIILPHAQRSAQGLTVTVSGNKRKVFVFGVDNPDDAAGNFYIP